MKTFKIFIASSSELEIERKGLELCLYQENQHYKSQNIEFIPILWENLLLDMGADEKQKEFTAKLKECDVAIFMFWKKIGKYTQIEFDEAYNEMINDRNPKKIFLFFKEYILNSNEITEEVLKLNQFKENISKIERLYIEFQSIDKLIRQIKDQIRLFAENFLENKSTKSAIVNLDSKAHKTIPLSKPQAQNQNFLGREVELKEIEAKLNEKQPLLLLSGLGGIGKTELAKEYYHQNYDKYDYLGWINYNNNFKESLINSVIPETLKITKNNEDNIETQYRKYIAEIMKLPNKSLFIIDNVDNPQDSELIAFTGNHFDILMTSRGKISNINSYEVGTLPLDKCYKLFCNHYGKQCNEETAKNIIELANCHTLTLELLAKTAKASRIDLNQFYELLKEKGFDLREAIKEQAELSRNGEIEKKHFFEHLKKVFDISNLSEDEKNILLNLSYLPSKPFDIEIIKLILQLESFENLNSLIEKGWLKEIEPKEDDLCIIHNVIQEVIRDTVECKWEKVENLVNSIANLYSCEPNESPLSRVPFIDLGTEILKYVNYEENDLARLANNLSTTYCAMGELPQALEYAKKALEIREKVLGKDHPDLATSYNNLSLIYKDMGELPQALEYAKKALEIREKVLGKEHPDLATSYNNLSLIYQAMGELPQALEYAKKALDIKEKVLGKDHPSLATSYHNIGTIYFESKEYETSLDYLSKAEKILKRNFPNGHPNLTNTLQWKEAVLQKIAEKKNKQ